MGHRRSRRRRRRRRQCAATIMASSPPWLMEELVQEILLRLPPEEPASLVRAALVCKSWRRLVSSPGFRRRLLEFHRTPPMLGFICNYRFACSTFVRTTASSPLHDKITRWWSWCALDARHGRVLLRNNLTVPVRELVVWDPISDEQWELPVLPRKTVCCTAAVLCGTAATGACNHRGCHRGPFRVVCVGTELNDMFVCSYSSVVGAWSKPISTQRIELCSYARWYSPSVLLGNELYFGIPSTTAVLKYDLELHEKSWIQLPTPQPGPYSSVLITMDGGLGLVRLQYGILCIWLRMDTPEADAGWTQFKVIDVGTQLKVRPDFIDVVGFADDLSIVFVTVKDYVNDALYTFDLKTYMVEKQVYNDVEMDTIFPYTRFYSPALEATSFGVEEEPSAAGSSA